MISPIEFWDWFKKNNAKYFFLNQIDDTEEKEKILDDLLFQLHQYCDKLFFEIGGHADETQDLIITAEGKIDYFSKVEELVEQAPKLKDWNIIAFKPATSPKFIIEYQGAKIDAQTAWFMPLENKNKPELLGLRIFVDQYDPSKKKEFLNAAYLILDSLLGEKNNALYIRHIDLATLPANPEEKGLLKISDISQYLNWKKSNR